MSVISWVHAVWIVLLALASPAGASEIWFAGVDPIHWPSRNPTLPSDYMGLFESDAPWSKAAGRVNVFKVSTQFLERMPDETLSRTFAELKRRNIALAVEGVMLTRVGTCGVGVEGHGTATMMESVAERVRRLGGELRYVAMDEPLWFGHRYAGPNACKFSVEAVARDVAGKVAAIRKIFPQVQVGDIEPVASPEVPDWVDQVMDWTKAYEAAAGEPLAFFEADMQWRAPWSKDLRQLAARLRAAGIKFGVIYNGNPNEQSDEAWATHAEEHFVAVEDHLGIRPEQAILQTWMARPVRMLPETQPGTMTHLVNRYGAAGTKLAAERTGKRLTGRLSDGAGRPVGGATITVESIGDGAGDLTTVRTLTGTVPSNAATATLGVRINTECNCVAPADVRLGTLRYREARSGRAAQREFEGRSAAKGTRGRFTAQPAETVVVNTPPFQVTPGEPYTVEIPLQAAYAESNPGYVAIIFFDGQGKAFHRDWMWIEPTGRRIATLVTDQAGQFSATLDDATLAATRSYRIRYDGSDAYRLNWVVVQ
ncbi:MAG: hypothetical protein U1F33_08315 [Alphaproteobacteria bacterium]